jgi:hypothetical protein
MLPSVAVTGTPNGGELTLAQIPIAATVHLRRSIASPNAHYLERRQRTHKAIPRCRGIQASGGGVASLCRCTPSNTAASHGPGAQRSPHPNKSYTKREEERRRSESIRKALHGLVSSGCSVEELKSFARENEIDLSEHLESVHPETRDGKNPAVGAWLRSGAIAGCGLVHD